MAALKDYLDEMARIKGELQRMENDDTVTEDNEGDLRDTLLARWEELDGLTKPIIERMERSSPSPAPPRPTRTTSNGPTASPAPPGTAAPTSSSGTTGTRSATAPSTAPAKA
jgi:hypothetical protein